jgi:hypothetical protein
VAGKGCVCEKIPAVVERVARIEREFEVEESAFSMPWSVRISSSVFLFIEDLMAPFTMTSRIISSFANHSSMSRSRLERTSSCIFEDLAELGPVLTAAKCHRKAVLRSLVGDRKSALA